MRCCSLQWVVSPCQASLCGLGSVGIWPRGLGRIAVSTRRAGLEDGRRNARFAELSTRIITQSDPHFRAGDWVDWEESVDFIAYYCGRGLSKTAKIGKSGFEICSVRPFAIGGDVRQGEIESDNLLASEPDLGRFDRSEGQLPKNSAGDYAASVPTE